MESDSNYGGSSSSRIQNLVEDLGDESFETRNEALMTLKAMLNSHWIRMKWNKRMVTPKSSGKN